MSVSMLTTIDNPFDPFDDWDGWYTFDTARGYNTASFLARVVVTSPNLSEADQLLAIEKAIDEIVKENVNGLYKKVQRELDSTD